MHAPLITTIITTFRRPHLLKKAVESVLKQTYPHFQLIVCDNASQDDTREIMEAFIKQDARIRYYCHEKNFGMMANYQYGFSRVNTPYFSILSDDDVLLSGFYETALEAFKNHPELGFSACSTDIVTPEGQLIRAPLKEWAKEGFFHPKGACVLMVGKFPIPTGVLFNTEILKKIKLNCKMHFFWDCEFILKVAENYPVFVSKKPAAFFLSHEAACSKKVPFKNLIEEIGLLIEEFPLLRSKLQKWREDVLLGAVMENIKRQDYLNAKQIAGYLSDKSFSLKRSFIKLALSLNLFFLLKLSVIFIKLKKRILKKTSQSRMRI